jgi:hypothetical protein
MMNGHKWVHGAFVSGSVKALAEVNILERRGIKGDIFIPLDGLKHFAFQEDETTRRDYSPRIRNGIIYHRL